MGQVAQSRNSSRKKLYLELMKLITGELDLNSKEQLGDEREANGGRTEWSTLGPRTIQASASASARMLLICHKILRYERTREPHSTLLQPETSSFLELSPYTVTLSSNQNLNLNDLSVQCSTELMRCTALSFLISPLFYCYTIS